MIDLIQAVAQTASTTPPGPSALPEAFSYRDAFFELVQFVGYFLAIGALGFRFGIVRRLRGMSVEATRVLRPENAAFLGVIGVVLLFIAFLGGPYVTSIIEHKTFAQTLPKNLAPFELKMALLLLALIGFSIARAVPGIGWVLAMVGMLIAVLQPVYTGRNLSGRVNAVHILAASTWLGTLLVLFLVGIRGVIRTATSGLTRAELVCDLVNSFSPLALTAASIVALTGLTTAWLHLKRLSALWTSSYGIALIVKLVFVLMVVIMGAWNWQRVRPTLGESGSEETIRRSSTMELAFGALVLLATSVLVTLPSPR
jgi:putative copper export protein